MATHLSARGISNRNLASDLDNLLQWKTKIMANVNGIALHEREYCLDPPWQAFAVFTMDDCLMPDVISDVVKRGLAAMLITRLPQ
jgi:hypothetical protein